MKKIKDVNYIIVEGYKILLIPSTTLDTQEYKIVIDEHENIAIHTPIVRDLNIVKQIVKDQIKTIQSILLRIRNKKANDNFALTKDEVLAMYKSINAPEIRFIQSNRRSLGIEINMGLEILLRVPYSATEKEVFRFLYEKFNWVKTHLEKMQERARRFEDESKGANEELEIVLDEEKINSLGKQALEDLPNRCMHFANIMGVEYNRITIRNQKTKWGSCSSKSNLNFNCLLMMCPPEVRDYLVVHELCHLVHMNHSEQFWDMVKKYIPDYQEQEKWLAVKGAKLMRAMRKFYE